MVFGEEESYTLCGGEESLLWDGRSLNLKNARFWKDEEGAKWMRELAHSALGYDPIGYAKDWFDVKLASAHLSFPVYVEDGGQIRWDYRDQTLPMKRSSGSWPNCFVTPSSMRTANAP